MKITIKPKTCKKVTAISINEIQPGMVFEFVGGVIGLKLDNEEALLLTYSDRSDCFVLVKGYKIHPVKRILGYLDEIIVIENE